MCSQNRKGLILFDVFRSFDAFHVEVIRGGGGQIGTTLEILDGKINRRNREGRKL